MTELDGLGLGLGLWLWLRLRIGLYKVRFKGWSSAFEGKEYDQLK